ncbi:MAG: DUF6382 domain-containing protein [Clostridiales Family XIII bacterium]|jgi:hypothetical protein|nr:DUF6382 domain-containing protein [Clostridiales Family XIII bacterium]
MPIIEIPTEGRLHDFEVKILTGGSCGAFLPCYHLTENGAGLLRYDLSGAAPISRHRFRDTGAALGFLREAALMMAEAEDYLLKPELMAAPGCVFARLRTGKPGFVYGYGVGSVIECFRDMLALLGEQGGVVGLAEAAARLDESIARESPDLGRLAMMIEAARREWGIICPDEPSK